MEFNLRLFFLFARSVYHSQTPQIESTLGIGEYGNDTQVFLYRLQKTFGDKLFQRLTFDPQAGSISQMIQRHISIRIRRNDHSISCLAHEVHASTLSVATAVERDIAIVLKSIAAEPI